MAGQRQFPRIVLTICALVILFYYVVPEPLFGSKAQGDGWYGFHYLPALVLHHTLDMKKVAGRDTAAFDRGQGGVLINRNPIGPTLAMLPSYLALCGVEVATRRLAPRAGWLPPRPFEVTNMQVFWAGLTTVAAGILGMVLTYRLLRRHVGTVPALCGAVAAVFCTPIFWYLCVQPHYQHGLAFAAVTLLIERWDRGRGSTAPRRFLLLGALGGLAMLMRAQEFVFLLAPGTEVLVGMAAALRERRLRLAGRWLLLGLLLGLGAFLLFVPQLVVWTGYFGFLKRPANVEMLRPLSPAILETLFATRCGLLPWSPVAYLSFLGLGLAIFGRSQGPQWDRRRLLPLVLPLLVCFAADVYLVASSWMWYGAFGFGSRRLSDCAPLLGLGLALLCQRIALVRRDWLRRGLAAALAVMLLLLLSLNLLLVDLLRRRVMPSSGSMASPGYRWATLAHAPDWLVRALHHGYPFVQPVGWIFAWWHHAPATAWESVAGNYMLEREPHYLWLVTGERWDFTVDWADYYVVEGLLPADSSTAVHGRPMARHVRMLLEPFAHEPVRATLTGEMPPGPVSVSWDGQPVPATRSGDEVRFEVPERLVWPHRVAELGLAFPDSPVPPRLHELRLKSFTTWWKPAPGPMPLPTKEDEKKRRRLMLKTLGN